jgi:hypothetical protein
MPDHSGSTSSSQKRGAQARRGHHVRQSQVPQNTADQGRIANQRDQRHPIGTAWARNYVETKTALHQHGPRAIGTTANVVPFAQRRRRPNTAGPSGATLSRSCPTAGRSAYRHMRSSRSRARRHGDRRVQVEATNTRTPRRPPSSCNGVLVLRRSWVSVGPCGVVGGGTRPAKGKCGFYDADAEASSVGMRARWNDHSWPQPL